MAIRGRKPTPTVLKLVTGNPGRRPLNMNEPKPEVGIPAPPEHISPTALEEWNRVSVELDRMGVLTKIDRAALAAYCQSWADWVEAEEQLAKYGKVVKSPVKTMTRKKHATGDVETETSGGFPIQSPFLPIRNRALEMMHRFLIEFGMTPASRSRVTVEHGADSQDPANKYFAT